MYSPTIVGISVWQILGGLGKTNRLFDRFKCPAGSFRQAKLNRSAQSGGPPVPQSLPQGHSHLSTVSAVSPAHTHHNARPCAPSPSALKLASVASSLDRVSKVTPTSAIDSIARYDEPC